MNNIHITIFFSFVFIIFSVNLSGQVINSTDDVKEGKPKNYSFDCVNTLSIYPNNESFNDGNCLLSTGSNCNVGKILIWARPGDISYHTDYQEFTTNDVNSDQRFGVVRIEIAYPGDDPLAMVYFEVEDVDDESPYEADLNGGDNVEPFSSSGVGLVENINATTISSQSLSVMATATSTNNIAVVYLKITEQYSGDNYVVKASLDPNFDPASTVETATLVAWKRAYVEYDRMHRKGSYLIEDLVDDDDDDIALYVKNTNEFSNPSGGTEVAIFTPSGEVYTGTLVLIDHGDGFIKITNLPGTAAEPITIPKYSGVRYTSTDQGGGLGG